MPAAAASSIRGPNRQFLIGTARAFGGAIVFALPLLMTMEMWSHGSTMPPNRLAILMLVFVPVLIGLSRISGFEPTLAWRHDAVDAMVAYAVGFVASAVVLGLIGVIRSTDSLHEVVGKLAVQAVPASIGALLARSQLTRAGDEDPAKKPGIGYRWVLFLMAVGSLFLAFNIAPTEEMVVIAQQMSTLHVIALALTSIVVMHAFVFSLDFQGQPGHSEHTHPAGLFLRFTIPGYALALAVSAFTLWTFGRFDGTGASAVFGSVIVLGFPSALGAAAARLIL
jgi:putative integral membrane protein (TIGR02587 family)